MGAVTVHTGNAEMRVGSGVAVTREVLHRSQHSRLVRSLNVGRDQIAHLFGIFSEGSRVNDGVGGIRVHVGVREKIPVHTDGSGFLGGDAAEGLRVLDVAIGSEGHGVRKVRGPQQPRGDTALKVSREQQRQLGFPLQSVQQFGDFVGLGAQKKRAINVNRHGERTHVIFLHGLEPLQVLGILHVEEAGPAPDHQDLPDLFFDREPAKCLLGPLVAARGVEGGRARVLVFGE